MDINNIDSGRQQASIQLEKVKEEKKNLDREERDFLKLLSGVKRTNDRPNFTYIPEVQLNQSMQKENFEDLTGR